MACTLLSCSVETRYLRTLLPRGATRESEEFSVATKSGRRPTKRAPQAQSAEVANSHGEPPSGYSILLFASNSEAASAVIGALVHPGGWVVIDRISHRSLCGGVEIRNPNVVCHEYTDAQDLRAVLTELRARNDTKTILVVSQLPFAISLDRSDLAALQSLCLHHRAALLLAKPSSLD